MCLRDISNGASLGSRAISVAEKFTVEEKSSTPEPNTDDLALPNTFFTFDPQVPVQPPMGAPAGGTWIEDKYCGLISWVLCFVTGCCCIKCMCPCDTRNVSGKLRDDRGVRTACSTCSCIPRQHFACGRSIEASPQLDAVRSMIRHCRNFAPINKRSNKQTWYYRCHVCV